MCFDDQVLSAFYDGELERVWEARVKDHVGECPVCAEKLANIGMTDKIISGIGEPDFSDSKFRVHDRVHHSISADRELGFWYKKIYLPGPVFIAAAAVGFFILGLVVFLFSSVYVRTNIVSVNDANSKNKVSELIIKLPTDHKFQYLGEPKFIREVDFKKGQ